MSVYSISDLYDIVVVSFYQFRIISLLCVCVFFYQFRIILFGKAITFFADKTSTSTRWQGGLVSSFPWLLSRILYIITHFGRTLICRSWNRVSNISYSTGTQFYSAKVIQICRYLHVYILCLCHSVINSSLLVYVTVINLSFLQFCRLQTSLEYFGWKSWSFFPWRFLYNKGWLPKVR